MVTKRQKLLFGVVFLINVELFQLSSFQHNLISAPLLTLLIALRLNQNCFLQVPSLHLTNLPTLFQVTFLLP